MRFNRIATWLTIIISIFAIIIAVVPMPTITTLPTESETDIESTETPESTVIPEATEEPEPTATVTPEATETPKYIIKKEDSTSDVTESQTHDTTIAEGAALKIHQINVGCADAYLLQSGDINIMIDGGEKDSSSGGKGVRQRVINYLKNAGVSTLDAYIVTHWHGDHAQNMNAILATYGSTDTIVYGPSTNCSSKYTIPSGKGQYTQMVDGNVVTYGNITIKCMGPYKLTKAGENNYDSLNFLVKFGEIRSFFTGDYVYKKVITNYSDELKNVDVYKMAHHGLTVSNYSGSADVLPHLNPDIVLVPANSSPNTRSLLSRLGISSKVYDNKSGNVVLTTDGKEITVTTDK